MRTGVRLGIDVGQARIGVARSDMHGMLATPIETIPRDKEGNSDLRRLSELIAEYEPFEIVVGLPLNMQGKRTPSTEDAESFATSIVQLLAIPESSTQRVVPVVRLVDERLSTVTAQAHLHQAGKNTKKSRSVIDQAAAVVILQHALDIERAQLRAPGSEVLPEQDGNTHV